MVGLAGWRLRRLRPSAVRHPARDSRLRPTVRRGRPDRWPAPEALGVLAGVAGGRGLFLGQLLVGGRGLPGRCGRAGLDGPLRGGAAGRRSRAVLGPGRAAVPGAPAERHGPEGAGVCRGPVDPGMDARPHPDRLPVEPARRDLARGLAAVAGRRPGRRLWPDLDHPVRHGRPGRALRLRLPPLDLEPAGWRHRGGDRALRLRLMASVAPRRAAAGTHGAGGAAGRASGVQVRRRQVQRHPRPIPDPDWPAVDPDVQSP